MTIVPAVRRTRPRDNALRRPEKTMILHSDDGCRADGENELMYSAFPLPLYDEDPLDDDADDDVPVVTTRRGLMRVALIAGETAARVQRERLDCDPMAWMISPMCLFEGGTAIEACLGKTACLRALVMHGLGLGLDADPSSIDALVDDDDDHNVDVELRPSNVSNVFPFRREGRSGALTRPRLFTSVLVHETDTDLVHAFAATVARSESEAITRMTARHDPSVLAKVEIMEGFDATAPLVQALVSPAMVDMLIQVAQDPASPLAAGLEIAIEQRFAA
jgi:hypothetical protein